MNEHAHDDLVEYTDETSGHDFVVSLTDIMRCVKVAEERFLVPAVQRDKPTTAHGSVNSTAVVQAVNEAPKC